MGKRFFSILLCMVVVLNFLPIGMLSVGASETTVYSMVTDNDIQGKAIGDIFEGTTWLQQSGSPILTIVDNGGSKAISVTGREEDWYCIDLKNLDSLPDGFDYTIKVTGSTVDGEKMKLAQSGSPYGTYASQGIGSDGAFSLEKTFTYAELQAEKKIRIQSEGTTEDFSIYTIVITKTAASGGDTPPVPDGKTIEEDIDITFNDADYDEWNECFSVSDANNVDIKWVSDFGKDDTYALKGTHLSTSTDYTGANNAIRLTFSEPLAQYAVYTVSYSVYVPYEGNASKETLTGPGIVLSGDYAGSTGVVKFPSNFGTIDTGTWKEVHVTTPDVGLNETLKSIDFRFVVNDEENHPDVWYIDNIFISQELIEVDDTEPNFHEYDALKDVYEDYFLIGTTSSNHRMSGDKLDIIKYHFNAFTPENEMKPSSVQNVKGEFTYTTLNEQLAKVQGIQLIGHTLAWHSQSPTWMWGAPNPLSEEEAKANLDAHIENVMNEYGGVLHAIDVVNEAFTEQSNDDWRQNLRDNEGWYLALGSEWVEYAFLKAAEIVDKNNWDCKLYYNDYNLDYENKATSVYNMVKDINERNEGKRPNGKPLIEGIGMQGHYNQNTNPANIEKSIDLFSKLPGVAISVTELDITYTNTGSLTEAQAKSQAFKYAQLFEIYMKNAAGPANNGEGRIERITFWGTNDADSWRGDRFPLLFNRNLRVKEAFLAVLDPVEYLKNAEPPQEIPKAKSVYGTPELGQNDDIWKKASIINVDNKPTDQSDNAGANAVVKTLWDNSYFYVRAEVTDANLDAASTNPWEQDSVEIFFSETAHRQVSYIDGDGQYRVSFEGNESFKSIEMGEGFGSYAEVTDTGYVIEMKIPFCVIQPKHGETVNFDVQINDVSGGAATRQLTVWSDLMASGYNTTERWGELTLTRIIDGVHVYDMDKGDGWSGANIILGNDAERWPWSTAGADGKVAFTPEKEATYRISVNYTALGTNAIRIRWVNDATNGGYTTQDSNVVGASPSLDPNQTATCIPVYFNQGMEANNTYTLVTEIKLDGAQPENGLIGNIAIRGGAGGNEFTINWIKVEKLGLGDVPDELLVNWPPIDYTATANGAANTSTSNSIALVFEKPVPGLTANDIVMTTSTTSVKKGALTLVEGSNDTKYNLAISGVTQNGEVHLKITKDGVDDTVKTVIIHRRSKTGGSSGGSSSTPTVTKKPVVDATGKISTHTRLNVQTGTASAAIDAVTLSKAIKNTPVDDAGRKTIEVIMSAVSNAKAYELSMPAQFLSEQDENRQFLIKTGFGELIFPGQMISDELTEAKEVSLTITQVDSSELDEALKNKIGDRPVIALSLKLDGEPHAWSNPDATVTVSVPYTPTEKELADPEHITVWYIDGEGNVIEVPSGKYDAETERVTFRTTHFSRFAVVYVTKTFNDLDSVSWAKDAIEVLASKGITKGKSDDEFAPNVNITRADFLYYLIRALGVDAEIDSKFEDVSKNEYYYREIAIAQKLGITKGTGNNLFKPDEAITRQDMMVLVDRALRLLGTLDEVQGTDKQLNKFTDKDLIAEYAVDSVAAMVREGLIVGDGANINPRGNATRAEASLFIYRIYNW